MIQTLDQLLDALTNRRQTNRVVKNAPANGAAGVYWSHWRATGYPTQPAVPDAAATCDRATAGALTLSNPTAGQTLYLARASVFCNGAGLMTVADRLVHSSELSGTVTTAQAVNTPALPMRNDNAATPVEWYLEWYTDTGATAVTATITYTNQDGTTGRTTTVSVPATCRAARLLQILPASGDTAIQSIQSVQLSASTLSAGNFGVTALRRICDLGFSSTNVGVTFDFTMTGMPTVDPQSCLFIYFLLNSSSNTHQTTIDIESG
jgi:hypothetical protein